MKKSAKDKTIILFDGNCNFCTKWVLFLIKRDKHDHFRFSASSLPAAQYYIDKYNLWALQNESVIVIKNSQVYIKSDALLIILHTLGGLWNLLDFWTLFPHKWADSVYDWFSSNRYKWFGKRNSCMLPDQSMIHKFLDNDPG